MTHTSLPFAHPLKNSPAAQCEPAIGTALIRKSRLGRDRRAGHAAGLVIDPQHGSWERGALESAVGIAGSRLPVIARTDDFSARAGGVALDAGVAAVMAPLVETADAPAARQAFAAGYEMAVVANDIGVATQGFGQAMQMHQA